MTKAHVNIPPDSIYELQRSLSGVEIAAYLAAEPVSEKKPSRLTDVAFHSVRPWLATIDPKGVGLVWNYETRETVCEFSLGLSSDGAAAEGEEEELDGTPTAKGLLQRATASPTTAYVRSLRTKTASFIMAFYDHESVCMATRSDGSEPRVCFDEWLVVLTATHVMLCDLNQPTAVRSIPSEELQRQAPCSVEILPFGLLAIGCQDGKIRLWSPRLWRVVDTMDTGSSKDVQQLLMLPLRVAGASDPTHFLTSFTVDGRIVTWKVSASGECVKVPGVIELRDFYKAFDSSSGFNELRWHEHQEAVSAASKDGTVYLFDLAPIVRQSKQMTLMGILPTTKLPGASVISGPRKGAFVVVSFAASGSSLVISELVNKGRAVTKDNVPANYLEFAVASSMETRDLRVPVGQVALKKFKLQSLSVNPRDQSELCCVSTFGVFLLRSTCLATSRPVMITRGGDKSPLVLYPGPCRVTLRFYGEETSTKQEDYKTQSGADAANERLKMPVLLGCPTDPSYVAVLLPASTHVEIVQMDSELRNQKSINMHPVFSGNAISLAWHATKSRFALLVPHEPNARRLTRQVSSVNNTPRRRGFMFGGSSKGSGADDASAADARLKNSVARSMALAMYDIAPDGRVLSTGDNWSCGDDRLLHVFSGPLLGVVKFEAEDETPSTSGDDSPSMRNKRAESAMFSPTNGGGSNASLSFVDTESGDFKKATLEFFEWDAGLNGSSLKRVTATAIDAPLHIEWERVTHRFCALVYPRSIKIYRATPTEVVCLHSIPTAQQATSLKWMHHTLFYATGDDLQCCVISKTRVFSFGIASRFAFLHGNAAASTSERVNQFPTPQPMLADATTVLGICKKKLVLAAPVQSLHGVELTNRVLQCCILVAIGQADLALQLADSFSSELVDWLATVFEGFAFVSHALRLQRLSAASRINIAIKHNLLDELERVVQDASMIERLEPATNAMGTSIFQRACMCLHRGGKQSVVESACRAAIGSDRHHDGVFLATILNNEELLASALNAQQAWSGAYHASKRRGEGGGDALSKWNAQLHSATAPWKLTLEQHAIRAPDNVAIAQR